MAVRTEVSDASGALGDMSITSAAAESPTQPSDSDKSLEVRAIARRGSSQRHHSLATLSHASVASVAD